MKLIHLVLDSVAYATGEWLTEHGATCVPLSYHFEGKNVPEGKPGEFADFFDRFSKSSEFPTTSQPSVGAFAEVFDALTENGDEVICITLSQKISGTYNVAMLARAQSRSEQIFVIDSTLAAAPELYLAERAHRLIQEGKTGAQIQHVLLDEIPEIGFFILVETLEYLRRGGRIGNVSAMLGNLLGIRPIITFEEGALTPFDKVRGEKKAVDQMLASIPKEARWIRVQHVLAEEKAAEILERLHKSHPEADVGSAEIGPVIGIHAGPGTVGVAFR